MITNLKNRRDTIKYLKKPDRFSDHFWKFSSAFPFLYPSALVNLALRMTPQISQGKSHTFVWKLPEKEELSPWGDSLQPDWWANPPTHSTCNVDTIRNKCMQEECLSVLFCEGSYNFL